MSNEIVKAGGMPAHLAPLQGADIGEVIDVSVSTPRLYLMQGQSPEVQEGNAKIGDIVLRRNGESTNLGTWLHVVVVGFVREYVWWDKEKNVPAARCRTDQVASLPPERRVETQWTGPNNEIKPVAQETITLICLQYNPGDDILDPNDYGPFAVSFDNTSLKHGKKIAKLLRGEQASNRPYCWRVVGLKSDTEKNDKGVYQVWVADFSGGWVGGSTGRPDTAEAAKAIFDEWQLLAKSYPEPDFSQMNGGGGSAQQPARPTADEVKAELVQQDRAKREAAQAAQPAAAQATVGTVDYDSPPPF